MSGKQLTQWITNSNLLFKTMKSYRFDNRKITKYFEREKLSEKNNRSNNNEIIVDNNLTSKDNVTNKSISKIYLKKNRDRFG